MLPISIHKRLVDHLTTAVLVLKQDLRVAYSNSSAEMLLEISDQRSKGTLVNNLFRNANSPLVGLDECIKTGQTYTEREVELATLKGNHINVDYTASPFFEDGQTYVVMEIYARDRLQRISREEDLRAKQESSRMLIRGLAHEIKNPLGGIRGAAQLLDKELEDGDRKDYTRIIIAEADRLRNLVDRMLGPNQSFKQAPTNIHEVMERVVSLIEVESAGQIKLIRDYDPSIPEFIGDKEQLIQALLNIARNALQALSNLPEDKVRSITFKTRTLRQFTIGPTRHRLVSRIDIIDNGPGIPSNLQKSIFYPMVSGRPEGSGLGLSITQSIIGLHRGLVECESRPGKTSFIIFIPLEL